MNEKLQTLKGFRDFDVKESQLRKVVIDRLTEVFQKYGFNEISTPALEYQEVLLGKYGAEAEKLMYLFKDRGDRAVGLKYDLTVPLARFITTHKNLAFPFKRYQIQPVWRAENTQKGRYREFYQCDIDTVGSSYPLADSEILAVISECLTNLKLSNFTIHINSRSVLFSIMENAGISKDQWLTVIQCLDKLDKKTKEEVQQELSEKGLGLEEITSIFNSLQSAKPDNYLTKVIELAEELGVKNVSFTPTISRGLDYYDGPIFETVVHEPKIGSITGGGRYNKLLKQLGGPDLPAVGTTLGLERLIDVITELKLWNVNLRQESSTFVTIFNEELLTQSIDLVKEMRQRGISTEMAIEPIRLEKQLKYANENLFKYVVIVGPDEISNGSVKLKSMGNSREWTLSKDIFLEKIKDVSEGKAPESDLDSRVIYC